MKLRRLISLAARYLPNRVAYPADRYDAQHARLAYAALRGLERHNAQRLSGPHRKLAYEYARDVLGSADYAPWLYVYTAMNGSFREGWIPDNYFGRVVVPKINHGLNVSSFKNLTRSVLRSEAIPDIAYVVDGRLYDREMAPITLEDLRDEVGDASRSLFLKANSSGRGQGIRKLAASQLSDDYLRAFGNGVIQRSIVQHPFFDAIVTGSVATLRITTVKENDGLVRKRAAYLRLGRADTQWVQSDNSVRVAVTSEHGDLDESGYDQDWQRWSRHPDSGFVFAGQRIPRFADAVALCTALHQRFPHFGIVGWDVAVTASEGVDIIEWNGGHCGIKFSEAATGPNFKGLGWERLRRPG